MKLSRSLVIFVVVGFFAVFVGAVAFRIYRSVNAPSPAPVSSMSYKLIPDKTELKVGQKVSVPVYLSGDGSTNTTAFDVKFYYDSTKLKLTGATPGTFFDKYLTVKWDLKEAWFALAMSPAPDKKATATSPLVTLEFTAVAKSPSVSVSTGASTVYVAKTGGFHPQSGTVNFTIN